MILMFVLCEFARVLEQDDSHYCLAESRSCMIMREKEEEEHASWSYLGPQKSSRRRMVKGKGGTHLL